MPFELEKVAPNQYYVITSDTGKRHSNHPLTLAKAKAQLGILWAVYEHEINKISQRKKK